MSIELFKKVSEQKLGGEEFYGLGAEWELE